MKNVRPDTEFLKPENVNDVMQNQIIDKAKLQLLPTFLHNGVAKTPRKLHYESVQKRAKKFERYFVVTLISMFVVSSILCWVIIFQYSQLSSVSLQLKNAKDVIDFYQLSKPKGDSK